MLLVPNRPYERYIFFPIVSLSEINIQVMCFPLESSEITSGMRATLLFLLYPIIGELLFIDTIIKDYYTRRRIRVIFTLIFLGIIAITFAASELNIYLFLSPSEQMLLLPIEIRYAITGFAALLFFVLFSIEIWQGQVSLQEQIAVPEDRISLLVYDPRDVFTTLNRIINAAQYRRRRYEHCDNSRLANYALTVLSEYLQARVFHSSEK